VHRTPATRPRRSDRDATNQVAVAAVPGRVLSEFEHLLRDGGCPVCAHLAIAERRFFAWFANENHSSATVHAQLRASMGMCPPHSRSLVDQIGAGPIMTIVAREALTGALERIRGESRAGSCPACTSYAASSEYVNHLIIDALHRAGEARLYRQHVGVCLPHLLQLVPIADSSTANLVVERLAESLADSNQTAFVEVLAGADDDAAAVDGAALDGAAAEVVAAADDVVPDAELFLLVPHAAAASSPPAVSSVTTMRDVLTK